MHESVCFSIWVQHGPAFLLRLLAYHVVGPRVKHMPEGEAGEVLYDYRSCVLLRKCAWTSVAIAQRDLCCCWSLDAVRITHRRMCRIIKTRQVA